MGNKGDIRKEEIQPDLPKRWSIIPFKQGLKKSGRFTKLKSSQYLENGTFPVIDQGEKFISGYIDNNEFIYEGDLPVVIFGDHTRILKFIDFPFAAGADGTKILTALDSIDSKFFYYYLKSLKIPSFGYSRHYKVFDHLDIPIPPLPEQQRIVAKLDALFGHLDSLREKLDGIPTLLKNFRQQVLTQAVTGELTKEWRGGKGLREWEEKILEELITEKPRNGYSPKGVEYVTEVKSLTLSATTKGHFDGSHIKYLDIEKPDMASHLWLKNGDILIQRSNSLEYVGTAAIYDGNDYEFIYPDLMMKLRANNLVETNYLFFVLSSNQTKDYFRKNATGTAGNMPKINQGTVMNTPIPYPSLIEQKEIISKVEALFTLADKIESQYASLKAKIDQLPQAILAKAFRGELVGQEVKEYVVEEIEGLMAAEPRERYGEQRRDEIN